MKSWVTKSASELLDTILIVIGSVVVIASYIFASDGLFGIPASPWAGLLGVIVALIVLLFPYYLFLRLRHNKKMQPTQKSRG